MKTLFVVLRKEFKQFAANKFLPKLCIAFPFMVMLILPLVANMEVKNVEIAIIDLDHSDFSRALSEKIIASEYTNLAALPQSWQQALALAEHGNIDVIIEVPSGFEASLKSASPLSINLSANAVNSTKASLGMQYAQSIISSALSAFLPSHARRPEIIASQRYLFNPTLNYKHFMIPALMIMLLVMLCGFLPALNIVGEKEKGTIEQINVSPISQLTFTLGKVIPYWIIGFAVLTLAMVVARAVYGLSPAGNILSIYAASLLFIIVMSSMAVTMANFSDNMQQVMFVMFFFVLVFILMSGLLTPVQSMPQWAQNATYAIPPRYYVDIMRATYLRGASMADLWTEFAMLGGFAALFTLAAVATYKKQS